MKNRIRYLILLMALLCGATAWAQDDFDPEDPTEPGQINPAYRLTLVAYPEEAASSLSGGGKYVPGTSVGLGASPSSGWKFVKWTDKDGVTVTSPYTKQVGAETLTAHFEFDPDSPSEPGEIAQNVRYWLTLAAEEGGSVSGGGRYLAGTTNTVYASANAQFEFVGWYDSEGGTLLSPENSYTVTMPLGGLTLLAKFRYNPPSPDEPAEIKAPHRVILTAEEGGYVSASSYRLAEGETTTIRANVNSGYLWDGWYQNGSLYNSEQEFTYTMGDANVEFEARFIYNPDSPDEPAKIEAKPYAFHLMNVIGKPGDTVKFPVYLTLGQAAKNISFQLTFPTELVPDLSSVAMTTEAASYSVSCEPGAEAAEGQKAYVFTLTGGELGEGDVPLLTFDITIPATQETGKGYPIYINQVRVCDAGDNPLAASCRNGRVSVYKLGDTNGDDKVNAADVMNIVLKSLEKETEVFIEEVSDFNNDGKFSATDVLGIVNIVLEK